LSRMNLGRKLTLGGLALLMLPMIAVGGFSVYWASFSMETLAGDQLQNVRKVVVDQVNETIEEQLSLLVNASIREGTIVEMLDTIGSSGVYDLANFMLNTKSTIFHDQDNYAFFMMTNNEGVVVGDSVNGAFKGKNLAGEEYFKKAVQGTSLLGGIVENDKSGEPVVLLASPLAIKEKTLGVGVLGWRIRHLDEKVSGIRMGKAGHVFLTDRTGRIITHPDKEKILKASVGSVRGMEDLARQMLSGGTGIQHARTPEGDRIIAYAPLGHGGWSLAVTQPRSEIIAPMVKMRNILAVALVAITAFLAGLVTWIVRRNVNRPIQRIVGKLGDGAERVSGAAAQLSSTGRSLAEHSSEQAASLEETSSSLEEMSSVTKQNAGSAREADHLMQETNRVVEKANASMTQLTQAMGDISHASEETSRIVKSIDEIAFQTNLLALNAAVEAARAGQAGAGFAVVADEVRALAIRAAEAARNTAGLIEGTVTKVQEGSQIVNKTASDFSEVADRSHKVGGILRQIATASDEQARGIEQINQAVTDMDSIVQQNAAGAEESAGASQEMNVQAEQLKAIVEELITMVGMGNRESTVHREVYPPSAAPEATRACLPSVWQVSKGERGFLRNRQGW
jgi:methyl-accepting chemotaxis protein